MRRRDHPFAACSQDDREKGAGRGVAQRADERRRNRFERNADSEICRSPEHAHRNPGKVGRSAVPRVRGESHSSRVLCNLTCVVWLTMAGVI